MARKLSGPDLIIATHNAGKTREFEALFAPYGISVTSAAEHGLTAPDETGTGFEENAAIKARAAATAMGLPALADDSGLAVSALQGAPGVYSARWGGPEGDFARAMERVEQAMQETGTVDRSARFVCVLALAWPDGHLETGRGECLGGLIWPPRGAGGFGYDAMFVPEGARHSFGEMSRVEKQAHSHRAMAFEALRARCL